MPKSAQPASSSPPPTAEPNRRHQILATAYRLIATRGFEGLRFREVAQQTGINNATLWYYFPTKEALIRGVGDYLAENLQSPPQPLVPANALEELRAMFAALRQRVTADPSFFIVITELALRAQRDPAVARIGQQRDKFWERNIRAVLERGIAQGVFRSDLDLASASASLMVQMKGIAHHAAMRPRPAGELDAVLRTVAAQVEQWLTSASSPRPKSPPRRKIPARRP